MTAYRVRDIPAEPLIIIPTRDGEPIDLDGATASVTVGGVSLATAVVGDEIEATWPSTSPFHRPGLYPVILRVNGETFEDEPIVIEAADGWHTLASARRVWTNNLTDEALHNLLSTSRTACIAYLGHTPADYAVTTDYRAAQLMQARNTLNAQNTRPGGGFNNEEYGLDASAFPMDWKVKALIRPPRIPRVR